MDTLILNSRLISEKSSFSRKIPLPLCKMSNSQELSPTDSTTESHLLLVRFLKRSLAMLEPAQDAGERKHWLMAEVLIQLVENESSDPRTIISGYYASHHFLELTASLLPPPAPSPSAQVLLRECRKFLGRFEVPGGTPAQWREMKQIFTMGKVAEEPLRETCWSALKEAFRGLSAENSDHLLMIGSLYELVVGADNPLLEDWLVSLDLPPASVNPTPSIRKATSAPAPVTLPPAVIRPANPAPSNTTPAVESNANPLTNTILVRVVSSAVTSAINAMQPKSAPTPAPRPIPRKQQDITSCKRFKPDAVPKLVPFEPDAFKEGRAPAWEAGLEQAAPQPNRSRVVLIVIAAVVTLLAVAQFGLFEFISTSSLVAPVSPEKESVVPIVAGPTLSSSEVAETFLHAPSIDDRIELLRDPRHAGLLREHFKTMDSAGLETKVAEMSPMPSVTVQGLTFDRFHVHFTDGRHRLIAVAYEKNGLFVDWKAYARYGTASWEDLVSGKAAEAEMRAFAKPADYHNHVFADPKRYQVYELTSPDWIGGPIHAYVPRKTKRARMLAENIMDSQRVTLRLKHDPESPNAFLITKIIAIGWVEGGKDYEDRPFTVHVPEAFELEQGAIENMDLRYLPPAAVDTRENHTQSLHSPLPSLSF